MQDSLFQGFLDTFRLKVEADVIPQLGERPTDWHVHPWDKATTPFLLSGEMPLELCRSIELDEVRDAASLIGIRRCMPIQVSDPGAGELRTVDLCQQEALRLRAMAALHDEVVACCVGISTEGDRDELVAQLSVLQADPNVVSVRNIYPQNAAPNVNPFGGNRYLDGIAAIVEAGLAIEILCKERLGQFPHVLDLIHAFPDGRFIINHCGKPKDVESAIPSEEYKQFLDGLAAERAEVVVKIGGLDEEAALSGARGLPLETFAPFYEEVFQRLGPEAIVMESNYPVSIMGAQYSEQSQAIADSFARQWYWVWQQGYQAMLPKFMYLNAERILKIT